MTVVLQLYVFDFFNLKSKQWYENYMECFYVLEQTYTINKTNFSGSIVPKLEAAMGPRMTAGASGPQHAFIQRKTALSKHIQTRFGDGPNDWGTPRGPGRYPTLRVERLQ